MRFSKIIIFIVVVFLTMSLCFSYKILSSKYKSILFGKIIYVDAGHGGNDNGASFGGVLEDEVNLKITGYVFEYLFDLGAYILLTRTGDYDLASLYDKNKKRVDLINRVKQINESKADLFVSVHLNSFSSNNVRGGQVFYQSSESSKLLASSIQDELNGINDNKEKKTKFGDYYILNKTNIPGVIVECGFLSNEEDRKKLVSNDYQKKVASKIVDGIIRYFNNSSN